MPERLTNTQPVLRTRTVLIAGFTSSLLMCLILGGIAMSFMYSTQSQINAIVETHNVKTTLLYDMFSAARERSLLMHMMLDMEDPFLRDELFLRFNRHGGQFARARIKLLEMTLNTEEQALLDEQGKRSGKAVPLQRQVIDLIQADDFVAAEKLLMSKAVPAQDHVLEILLRLRQYQETAARNIALQNKRDLHDVLLYTIVLGGLAIIMVAGIAVIITRRTMRTELDLIIEKQFAEATLHSIGEAVIATDCDCNIVQINPVAETLTGCQHNAAISYPILDILQFYDADETTTTINPLQKAIETEDIVYSAPNVKLRSGSDQTYAIDYTAAPIRDRQGKVSGGILVFRDVTEFRSLSSQLNYQASHDTLTGLVNRHEFELRLQQVLTNVRAEHSNHALCYMDLDQFKIINDTCGHAAGDELLKQLATNLKNCLRESDTLARLGGDEFGVILDGCSLHKAKEIAEKLRKTVHEYRFSWDNKQFDIGVSIGVVPINPESGNLSDLLSGADNACYEAKDLGRNRIHLFDPGDINLLRRKGEMQWVHRINDALENDLFVLYCQPIHALKNSAHGDPKYEVLIRLDEQTDHLVPPSAFIPAAERYGLMPSIDRHVVQKTITCLEQIPGQHPMPGFAINISGQSISDDSFHKFMLEILDATDIDASCLTFEITETATIANFSQATRFISALKEKGCRFALDDFGSGLSSFSYLKNIPVDYLKIDGSFIRDITTDRTDFAFVESINQIGNIMGIKTIAEFVETGDTLAALQKIGVDFVQGYHLGHPVAMDELLQTFKMEKSV